MKESEFFSQLEPISFGFAVLDSSLVIKKINSKFACILQKEEDELLGKKLNTYLPEFKVFSFTKPYELEKINMANGQTLSLDLLRVKSPPTTYFLVFCRDRTKYQQLSEQINQLNDQLALYQNMFNVLHDGIFICDGNGVTLYVNDAFLSLSGLKREDVLGKSVYYLMENDIVPNSCSAMVLRTKTPASTINNYYRGKSCLVSGTPVFSNGELTRVISIVRDLTELNILRDKLANITSLSLGYKHQLKEIEVKTTNKNITNIRSKMMRNIYEKALKVADVDSPVLLLGETGVGKDFLAQFIHDVSERSGDGCFVKVNCGAIPEALLESELFGYEPGAFTGAQKQGKAGLFEVANNGTIYLDEIGDMPLQLQVKLLNALQDKKIYRVGGTKTINLQTRVIAATNANLEKLIAEGKFRRDLYYRLNVIEIKIPALRYRRDDIVPLAMNFLEDFNSKYHKSRCFSPQTIELFLTYDWPGNIREMKNTIERLVIISDQDCIEPKAFEEHIINNLAYTDSLDFLNFNEPNIPLKLNLKQRLENFESAVIREALEAHETLKEASDSLGIDLSTLVRKKQKYNLQKKGLYQAT